MRKIIFGFALFAGLFFLKSATANAVFASTISGVLDNRQGSIPVTVSLYVTNQSGSAVPETIPSPVISPGATYNLSQSITSGDFPSVTWFTSCNSGASATSGSGGAYTFTSQDVHCTNTNSTVSITSTSCTSAMVGNVGWRVNLNPAPNDTPNIANFKVFRALAPNSADTDTSPVTVLGTWPYVNSQDLTGLSAGTYNVKVVAYANSPDSGSTVNSTGQFTCSVSTTIPTNLVSNVACSGNNVRVDFTWVAPTGTTIAGYTVETSTATTDPGAGGTWSGPSVMPSPNTNTYAKIESGLVGATTYWWHVKATPQSGAILFSNSVQFTTVPSGTCYQAAKAKETKTCVVHENGMKFIWETATPASAITSQYVQMSQDPNFATVSTELSVAVDATYREEYSWRFTQVITYYWRVKTQMGGQWYYSNARLFWTPDLCDTGVSSVASVVSYCAGNTPSFRFQLKASGAAPMAYTVGLQPYTSESVANFGGGYSLDLDNGPSGNYWLKHPNYLFFSYDLGNLTPASCPGSASTPPAPTSLGYPALNITCDVDKKPHVGFTFRDNSTNENEFWLEVSSQPFTGPLTTNPGNVWAKKVITRTSAEQTATGGTVTFDWYDATTTNTAGKMGTGNANPQASSGSELVPLDLVTYYWRVRARNTVSSTDSTIMYPDGSALSSTYATGLSFTILPPCQPRHDLKVSIDTTSWFDITTSKYTNYFQAGDSVSVDVIVTNVSGGQYMSSLSQTVGNTGNLVRLFVDTASSPPTTCASGGSGYGFNVPLNLPSGGLGLGDTIRVPVPFTVSLSTGGFTAYAQVVPGCTFSDGSVDPVTNNNASNASSYTVGVDGFFETIRGDVGAKGTISVGVNSSALATPVYQSDYAIAAVDIDNTNLYVQSKNNLELDQYAKSMALPGGVYKYFADRFLAKAKANDLGQAGCTITNGATYNLGNKLYYCDKTVNIDALGIVYGNPVFFIDGDLNINNNAGWGTPSNSNSVVFVVKGNINVATSVQTIRAVLISGGSFTDGTSGGEIASGMGSSGKLLIWGALYVDGQINLVRHWGATPADLLLNGTTPSLQVAGNLANIPLLSSILTTSPVGWKEVAP